MVSREWKATGCRMGGKESSLEPKARTIFPGHFPEFLHICVLRIKPIARGKDKEKRYGGKFKAAANSDSTEELLQKLQFQLSPKTLPPSGAPDLASCLNHKAKGHRQWFPEEQ